MLGHSKLKFDSVSLLNLVVLGSADVGQFLSIEERLLVLGSNTFLLMDLALESLDGVGRLNLDGKCISGQCLDADLH